MRAARDSAAILDITCNDLCKIRQIEPQVLPPDGLHLSPCSFAHHGNVLHFSLSQSASGRVQALRAADWLQPSSQEIKP
jgi:hypothetical protein